MRSGIVTVIVFVFLSVPALSADTKFPYTAEVSVDAVEVRCGPGWDYYPTTHLKRGAKVEVYRHEPDGWLAIRPPAGSVSMIPARQVERTDESRVGKVLIEGAVAWVGSRVAQVQQHKWQVRLKRDELVEIQDERSMSVGPGFATETHLQIAPPAGEFRWIHSEFAAAPGTTAHRTSTRTIELTDYTPQSGASAQAPSAIEPRPIPTTLTSQPSTTRSSKTAATEAELEALRKQVDQLKLDLSLLVSKQISQWDLQGLRQRAEALGKSTKGTPLARQVRLLAYRIGEFEVLQQRHERMTEIQGAEQSDDARVERHGVSAAPQIKQTNWQQEIKDALKGDTVEDSRLEENRVIRTGIDRLVAEVAREKKPQFDAEGWLMPVHSSRRIAPPYALLDHEERVICYVTPAPGLNLRRHAKQYVGLFGKKQPMTDLRASLLTVTRIVRRKPDEK